MEGNGRSAARVGFLECGWLRACFQTGKGPWTAGKDFLELIGLDYQLLNATSFGMKPNRMITLILGLVVAALTVQSSRAAAPAGKFGMKWNALIGEWKGESASGGAGACGFHRD